MKTILLLPILLCIIGCKDDISTEDRARIKIEQIRQRYERTIDLYDHDQCMGEYATALSKALSEYVNVKIYGE